MFYGLDLRAAEGDCKNFYEGRCGQIKTILKKSISE